MADLDDFFAKRDKKKPKGKKFACADDTSKVLENKAKERKKAEIVRTTYVHPLNEQGEAPAALSEYRQQAVEDDEWKEVVDVKPDYTGLKIQELVLDDDEDEFGPKDPEVKEEGEDDQSGPWSKQGSSKRKKNEAKAAEAQTPAPVEPAIAEETVDEPVVVSEAAETPETAGEAPEEAPKKTGGYVPPARRQEMASKAAEPTSAAPPSAAAAPAAAGSKYVPPSRRGQSDSATSSGGSKKKQTASLDLNDESFPSLGS